MRATTLIASALVVSTLPACSTLAPRLEPPEMTVVGVQVVKADLMQQQLRVRMRVHNPNDRALPVRGIKYTFQLAGEDFAHGDSDRDFTVPALGETEFDVNVHANAAPMVLRFITGGSREPLQWRLRGRVQLSGGLIRSIPFDETGTLDLR
jgi:LEA14-like dessication related protein